MVELREGSALLHLMNSGSRLAAGSSQSAAGSPQLAARGSQNAAEHRPGATPRPGTGEEVRRSAPDATSATKEPPAAGGQPPAGEGSEPSEHTITCGFCGKDFVEDPTQATCQACPLKKSCGLMRCPHCGYENAKEPGWIARIKEWIG